MYGAVAGLLERVVSDRDSSRLTDIFSDPFNLLGYQLPPGTILGTQAWSMHREPEVFRDPEYFNPDRWLPCKSDSSDADRLAKSVYFYASITTVNRLQMLLTDK